MRTKIVAGLACLAMAGISHAASLPASAVRMPLTARELSRPPAELAIAVPGGRTLVFRTQADAVAPGMVGIRGRSAGDDRLVMFLGGRAMYGDIHASGGRFRLVEQQGAWYWVPFRDAPLADSVESAPPADTPRSARAKSAGTDAAGQYVVDLLVLYLAGFRDAFGGTEGAHARAHHLVFLANTFLANSSVPLAYRVVGLVEHDPGPITTMEDFSGNPEVQALRNAHGADLVTLLTGSGCASFAAAFNSGQETPDGQEPQFVDPERHAYSVVNDAPNCRTDTLAHELGHNVGAGHDFAASGTLEWKEYAHGWDCGDAGSGLRYASVMHYGYVAVEARGDFFSTPDVVRDGEPCGSDGPVEAVKANNAKAIGLAVPYVVAYREPATVPAQSGSESGAGGALAAALLAALGAGGLLRGTQRKERH